tara:strand:- start:9 stop:236 length:228 start_codon:yes stop_codon:yes gene_type:complete
MRRRSSETAKHVRRGVVKTAQRGKKGGVEFPRTPVKKADWTKIADEAKETRHSKLFRTVMSFVLETAFYTQPASF